MKPKKENQEMRAAHNLSNTEVSVPSPTSRLYVQGFVDSNLRLAVEAALEKVNRNLKTGDRKVTMTDVLEHGLRSYLRQVDPSAAKKLGID